MGKRHVRHPEAVAKERAKKAPPPLLHKGWRPDYGWLVIFYLWDGSKRTRDYPPGSDAALVTKETRLALRESPKLYEKAWIVMKNGRRSK